MDARPQQRRPRGGELNRFTQALVLTAPADLTQDLLVRGVQVMLDQHDMLRARLVEREQVMEVLPPGSISAEGLIHRVAVDSVDDEGFRALASENSRPLPTAWIPPPLTWCA
ncbi:hypothetical protein GCM10020255_085770 [Rhodococcus baikonurensis]